MNEDNTRIQQDSQLVQSIKQSAAFKSISLFYLNSSQGNWDYDEDEDDDDFGDQEIGLQKTISQKKKSFEPNQHNQHNERDQEDEEDDYGNLKYCSFYNRS